MELSLDKHIERKPGVCGGKPCIAGTRIRVQDVYVWHELHGRSPDQIVADFPHLTLADVHAALAYYWDHRDEIHSQMKADEAFVAELKSKSGPGLLDRFKTQGTDGNSRSWLGS